MDPNTTHRTDAEIVGFESEGDQVSIDWADGQVDVIDRESFLVWVNYGYQIFLARALKEQT